MRLSLCAQLRARAEEAALGRTEPPLQPPPLPGLPLRICAANGIIHRAAEALEASRTSPLLRHAPLLSPPSGNGKSLTHKITSPFCGEMEGGGDGDGSKSSPGLTD